MRRSSALKIDAAARTGIGRYLAFNDERPHQALGYQTPAAFYTGLVRNAA